MALGAAFLGVYQIEECLDVFPTREAGLGFRLSKASRRGIPPTALTEKGIPHLDLFIARLGAVTETPSEDFLIASALQRASGEGVEIDSEKFAQAVIEGSVPGNDPDVIA